MVCHTESKTRTSLKKKAKNLHFQLGENLHFEVDIYKVYSDTLKGTKIKDTILEITALRGKNRFTLDKLKSK